MNARRGLTLLETVVVISVLTIVAALSVVGVQKLRAAAARTACANQLKQIALACHSAHDQHKRMPPAFGFFPKSDIYNGTSGLGTVFFHLLPHLDQNALYQQSRYKTGAQDFFFATKGIHLTQVALFNCPADPSFKASVKGSVNYAPSSYAANYVVFGNVDSAFANANAQGKPKLASTFPDGASQTVLFAEKYASAWQATRKGGCHWAYFQADCHNPFLAYHEPDRGSTKFPTDPSAVGVSGGGAGLQIQPNANGGCNPCLPATGHTAMNTAMADASVRALTADISAATWWALLTPDGKDTAKLE